MRVELKVPLTVSCAAVPNIDVCDGDDKFDSVWGARGDS
jgi:hypothetical protein